MYSSWHNRAVTVLINWFVCAAGFNGTTIFIVFMLTAFYFSGSLHFILIMSSGGGDNEPAPAKKRGRGPTTLTRVTNKTNKKILFDKFGRPIYDEDSISYPSALGVLVRANVPIKHRVWSDVPNNIKTKIWLDIKVIDMKPISQALC